MCCVPSWPTPQGAGFDLVAANTAEIARLVARRLLAPLPVHNIPNTERQLPRFRQLHAIAGIAQGSDVYAMPYTYSEMGLIYDRQQITTPPASIAVLWDPRWRGRVLAFDGSSHGFSLAAMYRGMAPFHIPAAQFGPLARDLVALRGCPARPWPWPPSAPSGACFRSRCERAR